MKTMKGPAIFLAQFAGDSAPFDTLDAIGRWAAALGYKGIQIPTWDARLFDLEKAAQEQDLLRRDHGPLPRDGLRDHRALDAPPGPAGRRASGLRRRLRRLRRARGARQPEGAPALGGQAGAGRRQGVAQSRPRRRSVTFSGALAWPYLYPWPPRSPGLDRGRLRRARQALAADLRRLRRRRRRRRASSSIPARTCTTATTFEMFLERVGSHPRCGINYDPSPLRAAAARLPRLHRHLPRAHLRLPRQGRRVQPDRPPGRLLAASRAGSSAPGASARSATGRSISARSSRSSRSTTTTAGPVLEWECALKHPEQGARRGRAVHRAATSSASPSTPSTTSPAAAPT